MNFSKFVIGIFIFSFNALFAMSQIPSAPNATPSKSGSSANHNQPELSFKQKCKFWDTSWRGKLRRLSYPLIGTSVALSTGTLAGLSSRPIRSFGTYLIESLYNPLEKKILQFPPYAALPLKIPLFLAKNITRLTIDKIPSTITFLLFAGSGAFLSHKLTQRVSRIHHQDDKRANFYSNLSYKIMGQAIPFTACFFTFRRIAIK